MVHSSLGYPIPPNEEERLEEILAHSAPEGDRTAQESLDQLCLLAQSLFNVPVALVTLVGRDQQTFLAKCGVNADGTSRKDAFCTWTILNDDVMVVDDATKDQRFVANPLVTGEMHVRFYAGAPLTVRPGVRIGSFCLIDNKPRKFSAAEAASLQMLAKLAVNELRRRRMMIDVRRQQDLLFQSARMTKVGSWSFNTKSRALVWSDQTYDIFGIDRDVKPSLNLLRDCWGKDECRSVQLAMEYLLENGIPFDREVEIVTARGERRFVRAIAEAEMMNGRVSNITGSFQNITKQREHAAEVERLAFRDTLTGLPNRAMFQQRFAAAVEDAKLRNTKVGLVMLDLDHFKDVNDTLGHDAGDALLCSVAERLLKAYRTTDTVARLGGDEFAVILPDVDNEDDLTRPTEEMMKLLQRPLERDGKTLPISASVGITIYPQDDQNAGELLKNADIAMYKAKNSGRSKLVTFERGMRIDLEERVALLSEVRAAIQNKEFVLYYQPLVNLAPRRVTGFEALMRWNHSSKGVLAPGRFLAAFEDQELSLLLGDIALDSAMAQMRAWMDEGVEFGRVAVNLSASQFRTGNLAEIVAAKLVRFNVPPERLTLEVTENVYMGWGSELVRDTVTALHKSGILIALDDFGTGYASLSHLNQFPIDRLKIDRSFVQTQDLAVVKAVLNLGNSMGMKVVAEGVEDDRQLEKLEMLGCDQVQGYFFAKPMPARDVGTFLDTFDQEQKSEAQAVA